MALSLLDVVAAQARIRPAIRPTPLVHSPALSERAGRAVWLKCENLQETGSFKLRGALNFALTMAPAERARGLVTASAGNHGLGTAAAARRLGLPLTVCVPDTAPAAKKQGIRRLGATLVECPGGYGGAHAHALALAAQAGRTYVPAYEDERIMAGQGTIALEVLAELPETAALVVPVGGGGLCAGIGVAARGISPGVQVWGAQSDQTPAMHRSLAAGRVVPVDEPSTLCDGLAGDIDPLTLAYARNVLHGCPLVTEAAVADAMRFLVREHRLIVEGSGAAGVALLLSGAPLPGDGPVVAVLSGGNVDYRVLLRVLNAQA